MIFLERTELFLESMSLVASWLGSILPEPETYGTGSKGTEVQPVRSNSISKAASSLDWSDSSDSDCSGDPVVAAIERKESSKEEAVELGLARPER